MDSQFKSSAPSPQDYGYDNLTSTYNSPEKISTGRHSLINKFYKNYTNISKEAKATGETLTSSPETMEELP